MWAQGSALPTPTCSLAALLSALCLLFQGRRMVRWTGTSTRWTCPSEPRPPEVRVPSKTRTVQLLRPAARRPGGILVGTWSRWTARGVGAQETWALWGHSVGTGLACAGEIRQAACVVHGSQGHRVTLLGQGRRTESGSVWSWTSVPNRGPAPPAPLSVSSVTCPRCSGFGDSGLRDPGEAHPGQAQATSPPTSPDPPREAMSVVEHADLGAACGHSAAR